MQTAISAIEARAVFDGPERSIFVRVGEHEGRMYVDLGDEGWRTIEIDSTGWRVMDTAPVRFKRTPSMRPLPVPRAGGKIGLLRPSLNVRADEGKDRAGDSDFVLAVVWLLATLRPHGPYPCLGLTGEQGTAKSTFSKIMRGLTDPCKPELRSLPEEEEDLFIAASNQHLLAFDNISRLPDWASDALCRLATGGGFGKRELYTNGDEFLIDAVRPVILNGITDIATRPDLGERTILLTLDPIKKKNRRQETDIWRNFDEKAPLILGALLDGIVCGMRRQAEVRIVDLPRMADFALWGAACETAYWPVGTFMRAYQKNLDSLVKESVDADIVATTLQTFMMDRKVKWTGSSTELLDVLSTASQSAAKSKEWPSRARDLSNRLRRYAPPLRQLGIEITFNEKARPKTVDITYDPPVATVADPVAGPSLNGSEFPPPSQHHVAAVAAVAAVAGFPLSSAGGVPRCEHCGEAADLTDVYVDGRMQKLHASCADEIWNTLAGKVAGNEPKEDDLSVISTPTGGALIRLFFSQPAPFSVIRV